MNKCNNAPYFVNLDFFFLSCDKDLGQSQYVLLKEMIVSLDRPPTQHFSSLKKEITLFSSIILYRTG